MCTAYHRDGKLIGKDFDLLDKVSNQFFIISEHLILGLLDGFAESLDAFLIPLFHCLPSFNLCLSTSSLLYSFSKSCDVPMSFHSGKNILLQVSDLLVDIL